MDEPKRYSGTWYNQHGSSMDLSVGVDGKVSGRFRSGVGLSHRDEAFDVTGFAAGEVIALIVNFSKYATLTTWTGHLVVEAGAPQIQAMWHMAVATPPRHGRDVWKGTWTGADVFQREPARKPELMRRIPSHPVAWQEAFELLTSLSDPTEDVE